MNSQAKSLWAELRRETVVLLVPEAAWFTLLLDVSHEAQEESATKQLDGTWLVPNRVTRALAEAAASLHSSEYTWTYAHFEGPLVSGTTSAAALSPPDAEELQKELVAFLRHGPFSWRIVSF